MTQSCDVFVGDYVNMYCVSNGAAYCHVRRKYPYDMVVDRSYLPGGSKPTAKIPCLQTYVLNGSFAIFAQVNFLSFAEHNWLAATKVHLK